MIDFFKSDPAITKYTGMRWIYKADETFKLPLGLNLVHSHFDEDLLDYVEAFAARGRCDSAHRRCADRGSKEARHGGQNRRMIW